MECAQQASIHMTESFAQKILLPSFGNHEKGILTFTEFGNLPFEIKRAFWISHVPENIERGGHAHKVQRQLLIAVSGNVIITCEDKSGNTAEFLLENGQGALLLSPQVWHNMRFSEGAVLLCLASSNYDEADYIRDYDLFKSQPV